MIDLQQRKIDYLRVSITDRCNLRCVYCMPSDGIFPLHHEDILTYEEIVRVCEAAAQLGISKIKITGGEPLVRDNAAVLVRALKQIHGIRQVTLTTNGILLKKQLPELLEAGVDAINISLDTLDPRQFQAITRRREGLQEVLSALEAAVQAGLPVKVNCLPIMEYNRDCLIAMAELAKSRPVDVRFIELMPIGKGKIFTPIPTAQVKDRLKRVFGELTLDPIPRGNGPAEYYALPGFTGRIGFISAMTHNFCSGCNRVRLTATGFLKLCLHYSYGVELREYLRTSISQEQLKALLQQAIAQKPARHQFGKRSAGEETHGMSQIGG